jgi:hypothetical protein
VAELGVSCIKMTLLILIAVFIFPILFTTWGSIDLIKNNLSKTNFLILSLLMLTGTAIGIYLGFGFSYLKTSTLRVFSFPLPVATFQKEGDIWVDYISPFAPIFAFWNVFIVISLFLAVFSTYRLLERIKKKHLASSLKCDKSD